MTVGSAVAQPVTIPSPEEQALYVKKATWKETAIATLENAHQFDADLHLAELNRRKIEVVARIAGPFHATEKDKLNIEDKGDSVSVMGKDYPWRVLEGFKTRDGNDLAQMAGLRKGDCALFRLDLASAGTRMSTVLVPHSSRHGTFLRESQLKNAKLTEERSKVPFLHPRYREKGRPKRVFSVRAEPNSDNSVYAPVRVSEDGTCHVSVYPNLVGIESGNAAPLPHRGIHTRLYERIGQDFPDVKSQVEMKLEFDDAIWEYAPGSTGNEVAQSWFSGRAEEFLAWHYSQSVERILAEASALTQGLSAANAERLEKHLARVKALPYATCAQALERFYLAKYAEVLVLEGRELDNAVLAVKDQVETFGNAYPNGRKNLKRLLDAKAKVDASFAELNSGASAAALVESVGRLLLDSDGLRDDVLLANPLLQTPLIMTRGEISLRANWIGKDAYGKEVVTLGPAHPNGKITTIHMAAESLNRIDLDWDARKLLLCDNQSISEINADGSGEPHLIKTADVYAHDAIRLPSGRIIYSDANVEQAIPCVGGNHVGNLHVMDADGKNQRRLCYDQDHNWHPSVLDDGRVMYLRWEYTAMGHYFSRILMTMNPDGTGQVSRYGSNSYWPNSVFWPRQVPGKPSQFIGIVSGHHGVSKRGHLTLFDSRKGTVEADGVVQKIGERGKRIEPVVADKLVDGEYPHYITPFPLGGSAKESGKYFLATGKMNQEDAWGLYLVDIYDNRTLIKNGDFAWARPLAKTQKPPVIPDVVDTSKKTAVVSVNDIYFGPGLKGIPRGAVKRLRIATPVYRYPGNGRHNSAGAFCGWDLNKIIGTVPVEADGSASFEAPANTPLFLQPLNAEGQALQVMRSWFVAMPGETVSCVGCHEDKNAVPPTTVGMAMNRAPSEIEPWYGEPRGFAFRHEVQPVLDRKCIGCHNGSKGKTRSGLDMPDLRGAEIIADTRFSRAYTDLQRYVRTPGPEPDLHMAEPTQWMADTSHLIKILKKGHHNVRLDDEEWDRLFTWVDLYAQYTGRWSESYKVPTPKQIEARAKYLKMYAAILDEGEEPRPTPAPVAFEKPAPLSKRPPPSLVDGWPFDAATAKQMQADCGLKPKEIALNHSVSMQLVPVPAGKYVMGGGAFGDEPEEAVSVDEPFYMSSTEVTYAQYTLFDVDHDNQHIEKHGGNRVELGILDMNQPQFPVVWVSQEEANAFCQWLSEKTGTSVSLPTEEQWEWAARAGSDGLNYLSEAEQSKGYNIADARNQKWNHGRYQDGHDDGEYFLGDAESFTPNAWGLYNMLGNAAEWTASGYTPLAGIGVKKRAEGKIPYSVVRGGSWNDTAALASLPSRWRYMPFQGVQDVGFRVIVQP